MRRLSRAGFKNDFVRPAILPDWWDDSCAQDPSLLPDVEIRVARFLGVSLSAVRDAVAALPPPAYPGSQLRRVRNLDRDRLAPAIHAAIQVASAVVRSLRHPEVTPTVPPADGLDWRERIRRPREVVTLSDLLTDLWQRGIPTIPIDVLPSPSFQGAACVVEGRPVILLGHKNEEPGRVAFLIAHEAGHLAAGDCAPGIPVVDEEEEVLDETDMEHRAEVYATRLLVGPEAVPSADGGNFREWANRALQLEHSTGADASAVIFTWGSRAGEYAKAGMAVRALYRGSGARRQLREHFDRHVDVEGATESDRALLRCVYGEPEHDAAAG